MSYMQQGISF